MRNYKNLLRRIRDTGQFRGSRSGNTWSIFAEMMKFDLTKGFPAVTCKELKTNPMFGELLWFMNGETTLTELKHRSNLAEDAWTIWTPDAERWHKFLDQQTEEGNRNLDDPTFGKDDLGFVYGSQWRRFGPNGDLDQLAKLVEDLERKPESRYHLVTAWSPLEFKHMALPPCHHTFQCYVREQHGGKFLDLMWHQRSVDSFLGLPFNIASYATLTHILANIIGAEAGMLTCTLGDTHIYENHKDAIQTVLANETHDLPTLNIPDIKSLDDVKDLTSKDFSLSNYKHSGYVKGKLSVG